MNLFKDKVLVPRLDIVESGSSFYPLLGLLTTFLPTIVSVGAGLGVALTSVLTSWGSHIDIGQVTFSLEILIE